MIFDASGSRLPITDDCRNAAAVMVDFLRANVGCTLLAYSAWNSLSGEYAELLSQLTLGHRYLLQQAGGTLLVQPSPRMRVEIGGKCDQPLTELLQRVTSDWIAGVRLMLVRLERDYKDLALPAGKRDGIVTSITGPLGEYSAGQTVRKIEFMNGLSIAYKPRPVDRDIWWFELATWLSQHGTVELFAPLTIGRKGYGWSYWIEAAEVDGVNGLNEFYKRSGQLLFWLWATNSCDAVASNVIAAGSRPYLIDCETVLYPLHPQQSINLAATGLVPRSEGPSRDIARTGLALSPNPHHWARRCFTNEKGEVSIDRMFVPYCSLSHMPQFHGRYVPASDHLAEVQAGFAEAYNNAADIREHLVSASSPIMQRSFMQGRLIARPTLIYGELITGYVSSGASEKWLVEAFSLLAQTNGSDSPIPLRHLRAFEIFHLTRFSIPKIQFIETDENQILVPALGVSINEFSSFDPRRRLFNLSDAGLKRHIQEIGSTLRLGNAR